jgi:hypothetical protein
VTDARARLEGLAHAYLGFADDEPALWRLMFGSQAAAYRATAHPLARRNSYDYLPAALMGLHHCGVVARAPDERDALFAWSAVHGTATLRAGRVPAALNWSPNCGHHDWHEALSMVGRFGRLRRTGTGRRWETRYSPQVL